MSEGEMESKGSRSHVGCQGRRTRIDDREGPSCTAMGCSALWRDSPVPAIPFAHGRDVSPPRSLDTQRACSAHRVQPMHAARLSYRRRMGKPFPFEHDGATLFRPNDQCTRLRSFSRCPIQTKSMSTTGPGHVGAQRPTEELGPGATVGEYRIDATIGIGGMGVVYLATQPLI